MVVVNVATPEERVPVPRVVPESVKVTVPVGTPPEAVTVALSVTVAPCNAGFGDTVRTVEVVTEEPPPCEEELPEQPCNSPAYKQTSAAITRIDNNFMKCLSLRNMFCDDKHMLRTIVPSNFVWKTNESRIPGGVWANEKRQPFPGGEAGQGAPMELKKLLKMSLSGRSNQILGL